METGKPQHIRFDLPAEDDRGELSIVEVQNETEAAYFRRMLFGTSRLVTECINRGSGYESIRKVYRINIVYFNFGGGTDIAYHGKTELCGLHNGEPLCLSPFRRQKSGVSEVGNLYPECYILKANDFNRWSKVPLEQWIYLPSTGDIPAEATAPGVGEAREKLRLERMTKAKLAAYRHHIGNAVTLHDNIETAYDEGIFAGKDEGRARVVRKGTRPNNCVWPSDSRPQARPWAL